VGLIRDIEKLIEDVANRIIDLLTTILRWVGSHLILTTLIIVLLIFSVELYRNRS